MCVGSFTFSKGTVNMLGVDRNRIKIKIPSIWIHRDMVGQIKGMWSQMPCVLIALSLYMTQKLGKLHQAKKAIHRDFSRMHQLCRHTIFNSQNFTEVNSEQQLNAYINHLDCGGGHNIPCIDVHSQNISHPIFSSSPLQCSTFVNCQAILEWPPWSITLPEGGLQCPAVIWRSKTQTSQSPQAPHQAPHFSTETNNWISP